MKRETRLKLKQLLVIIITWLFIGFVMSVYDHLVIHTADSGGAVESYSFSFLLVRNMAGGLIGALLGGSFLVFFVNVRYSDKPYGYTILAVSISYLLVFAFIMVVLGSILVPVKTGRPLSDPVSREALVNFFTDSAPLKSAIAWSFVVAFTQLLLQVNSKFGQEAFWNIIRGRYNTPKSERKVFMFLDLNASTTIAERLGDERYHKLLKDFFADITDPIIENKGEIYQYVGDEVIVAWKEADGVENSQCVKCFFDIKLHIERMHQKYISRYGLLPSFKAGIHYGHVIAGEIGIVKRDITYSGDVLNTTSRIQATCKELNKDVLISSDLASKLQLAEPYGVMPLGSIKLKGKDRELQLLSIVRTN
ncbi:MAG: adenylate/guanylate cyclase domain-containing protein [Bacteroidota bacterium]